MCNEQCHDFLNSQFNSTQDWGYVCLDAKYQVPNVQDQFVRILKVCYLFPRRGNGAQWRGSRAGPQRRGGTPVLYPPVLKLCRDFLLTKEPACTLPKLTAKVGCLARSLSHFAAQHAGAPVRELNIERPEKRF